MSKPQKSPLWLKRIIQAECPAELAETSVENEPKWVENILRELVQQEMPAFPFRKLDKITARDLGRLIGQHRANLAALAETSAKVLEAGRGLAETFNQFGREAITAAWDEASDADRAAFFQGLAEGLAKPGIVQGVPAHATTATPIYQILFLTRNEVQKLKSVRALRAFLLQCGLSEQVLGDPKRLEKICERIGLSFAGRGRPKRAK
jgi:hypothetical protein